MQFSLTHWCASGLKGGWWRLPVWWDAQRWWYRWNDSQFLRFKPLQPKQCGFTAHDLPKDILTQRRWSCRHLWKPYWLYLIHIMHLQMVQSLTFFKAIVDIKCLFYLLHFKKCQTLFQYQWKLFFFFNQVNLIIFPKLFRTTSFILGSWHCIKRDVYSVTMFLFSVVKICGREITSDCQSKTLTKDDSLLNTGVKSLNQTDNRTVISAL